MAQQLPDTYYRTPYKFNGKELDEETGLYYYGARYYDPKISIWLSVDPLAEKYPNFNPYAYCYQNPINVIDPTGMEGEGIGDGIKNVWNTVKSWFSGSKYSDIPKKSKSASNNSISVGEATVTFLPDENKIYSRVNQTTSIVYTIGSNEAPEYMFHYPRDLGEFSQEGSDGYIWTGCMSCHAPNGAYNFAARNSQENNAGQLLSVFIQAAMFSVANSAASITNIDDVMANPNLLKGKMPSEVSPILDGTPGWRVETLGQGSQKGNGWVFRHYNAKGNPTGPQLRWHPGGGHHGPKPYWRVIDKTGDIGGIIH